MSEPALLESGEPKPISLAAETRHAPKGIVSRTLLRVPGLRLVLFGFDEGQELTEHTTTAEAVVQVLDGACDFTVAGVVHRMGPGEVLAMRPGTPHAVRAVTAFSMLLTLAPPAGLAGAGMASGVTPFRPKSG